MSAHTQGRLTSAPLGVIRGGDAREYANGSIQDQIAMTTVTESGDQLENARRLVACWNVCRGFDTAHLENIDMVGDTLKRRFEALQAELKETATFVPLAKNHTGMRVDYSGMLGQACRALKRSEPGKAEMLRQLHEHLSELGRRYYAGDLTVVDEFLQLYCIGDEDRERVVAAQGVQS